MKDRTCSVAARRAPIVCLLVAGLVLAVSLSVVVGVGHPGAPDLAAWRSFELGASVAGRPLVAYQRIGRQPARHIVVVGVIHGDERAGLAITDALVAGGVDLPDDLTVTVVPNLNPDGSALNQRGNAHGVDLNRNFPFAWQALDESPFTMGDYNPGPEPLSEPESVAMYRWLLAARPDLVLWYHQPWGLVVCDERSGWECPAFAAAVSMPVDAAPRPGSAAQWSSDNGMATAVVELPERGITEGEVAVHLAAIAGLYAAKPPAAEAVAVPAGAVSDELRIGGQVLDEATLAEPAAAATVSAEAEVALTASFANTGPLALMARLDIAPAGGAEPPACPARQELVLEPGASAVLACSLPVNSVRSVVELTWTAALVDPLGEDPVASSPSRAVLLLPAWKLPRLGRSFGCPAAAVSRLRCSAQR